MILKELCSYLDTSIPLSFQEEYDNSGLQVGNPEKNITSAMVTLDVTEEILDEAVKEGCNLIVSHHPVIFEKLKRISGRTMTERVLLKAIKEDIAVYSAHTNLDAVENGVSTKMGKKIGLNNIKVLVPIKHRLLKLVTYVPESHLNAVRDAIFKAGAGVIGNYDQCGYFTSGSGSFRPGERTDPYVGEKGKIHYENELRFETVLFTHLRDQVIEALLNTHPYEEPAYDLYTLENENINAGSGSKGELSEPLTEVQFLDLISSSFDAIGIRYSNLTGRMIRRVALCGGSGASLINSAVAAKADTFVTADLKYHNFFDARSRLLLVDCGHYETEKFSIEILHDLIVKKFPKFAVRFSKTNTNPINYL